MPVVWNVENNLTYTHLPSIFLFVCVFFFNAILCIPNCHLGKADAFDASMNVSWLEVYGLVLHFQCGSKSEPLLAQRIIKAQTVLGK